MMKSYFRYEPGEACGVITAPQCNITYDFSGNLAITGSLQNISVWNIRQASQIANLKSEQPNYPYSLPGEVVILCISSDKKSVSAGYNNGDIRIFNYLSKTLISTLRGHRSAVISLNFDEDGTRLVSGSADSDILVWDMVTMTAVGKLRGHTDAVTGVSFLQRGNQQLIVSVSKDTLLKVWDIETQYCIQTIVGHRCEIWSLAISKSKMIVTGCSDELIRGYRIRSNDSVIDGENEVKDVLLSDDETVLEYYGCIRRSMSSGNGDRCVGLYFNSSNSLLGVQSSGKVVDIFHIRDSDETNKKRKRRLKRIREKKEKGNSNTNQSKSAVKYSSWDETPLANDIGLDPNLIEFEGEDDILHESLNSILSDEIEKYSKISSINKIRGFAFSPVSNKDGSERVLVSYLNNVLETYQIPQPNSIDNTENVQCSKTSIIDLHGHRSDVRGVALSADGLLIGTCSTEGIKIWSSRTNLCVRTCKAGYGLSIAFVPGARYVVVGTKEGQVQVKI